VLLIGEAQDLIAGHFQEALAGTERHVLAADNVRVCGDLEHAVEVAHALAKPGDAVLLSPGCASYDQFSNFEARGACFRELVGALGGN
jgi:UDP-N-acetylmuramoylalanine-D-glutamate ligase